jgi:hypothetical protein
LSWNWWKRSSAAAGVGSALNGCLPVFFYRKTCSRRWDTIIVVVAFRKWNWQTVELLSWNWWKRSYAPAGVSALALTGCFPIFFHRKRLKSSSSVFTDKKSQSSSSVLLTMFSHTTTSSQSSEILFQWQCFKRKLRRKLGVEKLSPVE